MREARSQGLGRSPEWGEAASPELIFSHCSTLSSCHLLVALVPQGSGDRQHKTWSAVFGGDNSILQPSGRSYSLKLRPEVGRGMVEGPIPHHNQESG